MIRAIVFGVLAGMSATSHATEINLQVANAYNEGVVRCSNSECARYLYACFRSYSSGTIDEFLSCGVQASRLNDDQLVVANPTS